MYKINLLNLAEKIGYLYLFSIRLFNDYIVLNTINNKFLVNEFKEENY